MDPEEKNMRYEADFSKAEGDIFGALAKAQSMIVPAGKSCENKFDHYKYSNLEDYWKVVNKPMAENGLAFPINVTDIWRLPDRQTRNGGNEKVVQVQLTGYLLHTSGQRISFICYGEGQDRSDKAIYKAITGGKKYLLANVFGIPTTDDDPERDSDDKRGEDHTKPSQGNKAPPRQQEPKPSAAQIKSLLKGLQGAEIKYEVWAAYRKKFWNADKDSDLSMQQFTAAVQIIKKEPKTIKAFEGGK
jgi:hypothetical protein